jgi:small conductance mechanosensitive channel
LGVNGLMPTLTEELATRFDSDPIITARLISIGGEIAVKLALALLTLVITAWLSRTLSGAIRGAMGRYSSHHSGDTTLSSFVGSIVRYGVWIIGLIAIFQQLGVQTTSILTVLGAASLAIGLALQGALANVAAGVMLLILRPYRVGDMVELNGRTGRVRKLDLFTTEVKAFDGLVLIMPNSKVLGEMIINYTTSGQRRMELNFGIDYADDADRALELLLRCAAEDERLVKDPPPWARVTALQDSSVQVTLRAWGADAVIADAQVDLVKRVKDVFEANGLSFPYPHQVGLTRREARGLEPAEDSPVFPVTSETAGMEKAPPRKRTTP